MTRQDQTVAYLCLEAPREGQASHAHVHEIIAGLKRRDRTVDLYCPRYSGAWRRPSLALRMVEYLRLQWALARRMKTYDVVYVRAHPLAFPTALVAKLRGCPIVHEVNGTYGDLYVAHPVARALRGVLDSLQRSQYRWASHLIAVTPGIAGWLSQETAPTPPPISVVANGANTDLFRPEAGAEPTEIALPEKFVVFFGGLHRWHGVGLMLDALQSGAWPDDVSLVVIGDGPEAPRLHAAAQTDRRLVLLGRQPYKLVPTLVAKAFAGLVCTDGTVGAAVTTAGGAATSAGLAPLKLYETLACGIPAIATDFPGQAELIRDANCGIVVPAHDGAALAQAVARLAADGDLARQMGAAGRAAVQHQHSWDARAAQTADILRDAPGVRAV